jgi:hypothetical protein
VRKLLAVLAQNQQKTTKPFNNKLRKLEFMLEIRRMLVAGDSPREVQSKLGLPSRTFWRYINSIFEKDRNVLKKLNEDEVLIQASILRDRYTDIYKTLDAISKDHTIDPEQRREACADMAGVAKLITRIYTEAPAFVAMQHSKKERSSTQGWMEDQREQLRQELLAKDKGFDWHNTEFARNNNGTEEEGGEEQQEEEQQQEVVRASSYNEEEEESNNNKEDLHQRLRRQQQEDEEAAKRGW